MKKILFITHVGQPGGAEFKMINICGLVENLCSVLMFQNGNLEKLLNEKKIDSHVIEMPSEITAIKRDDGFLKIIYVIPSVIKFIKKISVYSRKFDILVCMSQKAFLISALAKPFVRKPIIWFMNDLLSTNHFSKILIMFLVFISRFAADFIIVNSQASYDAWLKSGGRKKNVTIMYSTIDVDAFDQSSLNVEKVLNYKKLFNPNNKILIGNFGRLSPWKGQEVFIRAIANIENAQGVIVGGAQFGEEEYENYIKSLVIELGIQDKIFFSGHQDEIPIIMKACDIIVHTSVAPEPFGRVIVEGMLAKKPVIASDAGGAQEIIQHNINGQLTPMGDVAALNEAIKKYINNDEWAQKLAKEGRASAIKNFSNSAVKQIIPKIIEQL